MADAPIFIDPEKCRGCKKCITACPFDALYMEGKLAVVKPDECRACNACVKACPFKAIVSTAAETPKADLSAFKGIWVFAEQHQGKVQEVAYELLATGRRLAKDRGCELAAVVLGHNVKDSAAHLIAAGADKVYMVDQPELAAYEADVYTDALNQLIAKYKPEVVLAGATAVGRAFFAKVAVRARTGLTADCTALSIDKESYLLHQTRPAFGGNIMATIMTPNHRPQMATVRPKVFRMAPPDPKRKGETLIEALKLVAGNTRIIKTERSSSSVNIAEAEIIVAGGRGLKKAEIWSNSSVWPTCSAASWACRAPAWMPAGSRPRIRWGRPVRPCARSSIWRSASPARSSIWRACVEPIRLLRLTPIPMPRFSMWRISGS